MPAATFVILAPNRGPRRLWRCAARLMPKKGGGRGHRCSFRSGHEGHHAAFKVAF